MVKKLELLLASVEQNQKKKTLKSATERDDIFGDIRVRTLYFGSDLNSFIPPKSSKPPVWLRVLKYWR